MLELADVAGELRRRDRAARRRRCGVAAGELVCVVGPNGSGKTTLINAIAGLHLDRGGHDDVRRTRSHAACPRTASAREGIAIVPEGRRLFTGMTVRENLMLGSYLPNARAGAAGLARARVRAVSGACGKAGRAGGRAVRRAAADGRDRACADGAAAPAAARRAVARARPEDRAGHVRDDRAHSCRRRGDAAGRAERGARARALRAAPTCWRRAPSSPATRPTRCAASRTSVERTSA